MELFRPIEMLGEGTFGRVWKAVNRQTNEVVAVKIVKRKFYSWDECINLREVQSLMKLHHTNIVELKDVILEKNVLYFVLEYMEQSLHQMMENRNPKLFSEEEVREWCYQVLQGLAYMHSRGYFHRDLKPENLLVTKDIVKVADLGQAKEIRSRPPYTEYVATRWYRAPEGLLRSSHYNSAVDMWAMGAIMAELFTLYPLFRGASDVDQLDKICRVIGAPTHASWPDGMKIAASKNFRFPRCSSVPLSTLMPTASPAAIDLVSALCSWDPSKRPSAAQALQHPFFGRRNSIPPPLAFHREQFVKSQASTCPSTYKVISSSDREYRDQRGGNSNLEKILLAWHREQLLQSGTSPCEVKASSETQDRDQRVGDSLLQSVLVACEGHKGQCSGPIPQVPGNGGKGGAATEGCPAVQVGNNVPNKFVMRRRRYQPILGAPQAAVAAPRLDLAVSSQEDLMPSFSRLQLQPSHCRVRGPAGEYLQSHSKMTPSF